jgi:hypothetical protein
MPLLNFFAQVSIVATDEMWLLCKHGVTLVKVYPL